MLVLLLLIPAAIGSFVAPGACVLVGEKDCYNTLRRLASGDGVGGVQAKMAFIDAHGQLSRYVNATGDGVYTLQSSGRVGIDVARPTSKLHVNGETRASVSTSFVAMDSRLMRDGLTRDVNAAQQLIAVRGLRVREFRWKDAFAAAVGEDPDVYRRGLVSQEVELIIPHAVKATPQSETFGSRLEVDSLKLLNYEAVALDLIGAVQTLASENDRLQARLDANEADLAALRQLQDQRHAAVSKEMDELREALSLTAAQLRTETDVRHTEESNMRDIHRQDIRTLKDQVSYVSTVLFADGV